MSMLGTICGLVYGALSAASMVPLTFTDKTAALAGAFLNRFAIGFVIGAARLPVPRWANGLIFGTPELAGRYYRQDVRSDSASGSQWRTRYWFDRRQMGRVSASRSDFRNPSIRLEYLDYSPERAFVCRRCRNRLQAYQPHRSASSRG